MAGNINYKIQIQADASQAQRSVEQLNQSLTRLRTVSQQQIHLNLDYRDAAQQAEKLQTILQKAVNIDTGKIDFRSLTSGLQSANTNVQTLMQSFSKAGQSGQQAMQQLNQALTQATIPAQKATGIMAKFGTTLMNTFKWQIASNMVHGLQSAITNAVSYVEQLNTSLTNIRIVTGKSIGDMTQFAQQANKMARTLSTSTKAYADAALIYYQQGDNDKLAQQKANVTLKATNAAFKANAQEMSQMLTAVWNSYKASGDQLESYVDIMAKLGATTATSMEEIATSLQKVAATANTVGVNMNQMSSIVATVSSVTRESAEHIGTSFKTILARMGDLKLGNTLEDGVGLGKVSSTLASIGVNVLDATGNMRDMGDVITDLGNKWQTMNKAQKTAVAEVVAGKRQYTQLMALFENWGDYQKNLENTQNSRGSLQKMQNIYESSVKAAKQRVQASKENLWGNLVDDQAIVKFNDGLSKTLDVVTNIVKGLGGLPGILAGVGSAMMTAFQPQLLDKMTRAFTAIGTMPKRALTAITGGVGSYGLYNKSFQSAGILNQGTVALGDKMASVRFHGLQGQLYNNLIMSRNYINKDMTATLVRGGVIRQNQAAGYYENTANGQPLNVRPVTGENINDAVVRGQMTAADQAHYYSQQNALYANNLKTASMLQQGHLSLSQQKALENMQEQYAQRSADFAQLSQNMQAANRAIRTGTSAATLNGYMQQQGLGAGGHLALRDLARTWHDTRDTFVGPHDHMGAKSWYDQYNAQMTDAGRSQVLSNLGQEIVRNEQAEAIQRQAGTVLQSDAFAKVQTADDLQKLVNKEFSAESGAMSAKALFGENWAQNVAKATTPQEVQDLVRGMQQRVEAEATRLNQSGAGARTAGHVLFGQRGLEDLQQYGRNQAGNIATGRNLNSQQLDTDLPKATAAEKLAAGVKNVGQAALKAAQGLSQMRNIIQSFKDGDTSAQITSIATAAGSLINTFATQGLWAGVGQVAGMAVQGVISIIQGNAEKLEKAQAAQIEQADKLMAAAKEKNQALKDNYTKWQELNKQYETGVITYSEYQNSIQEVATALGLEDTQIQTLIGSYEALNTAMETNMQLNAQKTASQAKTAARAYNDSLAGRVSQYGKNQKGSNLGEITTKEWVRVGSDGGIYNWSGGVMADAWQGGGNTARYRQTLQDGGVAPNVIFLSNAIRNSEEHGSINEWKEIGWAIADVLGGDNDNKAISGGNIVFSGRAGVVGNGHHRNADLMLGTDMDQLLDIRNRLDALQTMGYEEFVETFGQVSRQNFEYMQLWISEGVGREVHDFVKTMTEGYEDAKDLEGYTEGRATVLSKKNDYLAMITQGENAYEKILTAIIEDIYHGAKTIADEDARKVGEQLITEMFTGMTDQTSTLLNNSKTHFGITQTLAQGLSKSANPSTEDFARANEIIRLSGLTDEELAYSTASMINYSGTDQEIADSLTAITKWRAARTKATTRVTLRDDMTTQEAKGTIDPKQWLTDHLPSLLTGQDLIDAQDILKYGSDIDIANLYSRVRSGELSAGKIHGYATEANGYVDSGIFRGQGQQAAMSQISNLTGSDGWDLFTPENVDHLTDFFLGVNEFWNSVMALEMTGPFSEETIKNLISNLEEYYDPDTIATYLKETFGISYDAKSGNWSWDSDEHMGWTNEDFRTRLQGSSATLTHTYTDSAGEEQSIIANPWQTAWTTSGLVGGGANRTLGNMQTTLGAYGETGLNTTETEKTDKQQELERIAAARTNIDVLKNLKTDVTSWDLKDMVQYMTLFDKSYVELLSMSVEDLTALAVEKMEEQYRELRDAGASQDELALADQKISSLKQIAATDRENKNAAILTAQETKWDEITTAASSAQSALASFMQTADQDLSFSAIETLRQNLIDAGMAAEKVQEIIDQLTDKESSTKDKIDAAAKAAGNAALAQLSVAVEKQKLYDLNSTDKPTSELSQLGDEAVPITGSLTITDIVWGDQSILDRVIPINGEVMFQNADGTLSKLENFKTDGVEIWYELKPKGMEGATNQLSIDHLWTGAVPTEDGYEYHLYYSMEPIKGSEKPQDLLDITKALPDADAESGLRTWKLAFNISGVPSTEENEAISKLSSSIGNITSKNVTQKYEGHIEIDSDKLSDFEKAKNLFDAFQNDTATTFEDRQGNPLGFTFKANLDTGNFQGVMDIWTFAHTIEDNKDKFADIPLNFAVSATAGGADGDTHWFNLLTGAQLGEGQQPVSAGTVYIEVKPMPGSEGLAEKAESGQGGTIDVDINPTGTPDLLNEEDGKICTKTIEVQIVPAEGSGEAYKALFGETKTEFDQYGQSEEKQQLHDRLVEAAYKKQQEELAAEAARQEEMAKERKRKSMIAQAYRQQQEEAAAEAARQQAMAEERKRKSEELAAMHEQDKVAVDNLTDYWMPQITEADASHTPTVFTPTVDSYEETETHLTGPTLRDWWNGHAWDDDAKRRWTDQLFSNPAYARSIFTDEVIASAPAEYQPYLQAITNGGYWMEGSTYKGMIHQTDMVRALDMMLGEMYDDHGLNTAGSKMPVIHRSTNRDTDFGSGIRLSGDYDAPWGYMVTSSSKTVQREGETLDLETGADFFRDIIDPEYRAMTPGDYKTQQEHKEQFKTLDQLENLKLQIPEVTEENADELAANIQDLFSTAMEFLQSDDAAIQQLGLYLIAGLADGITAAGPEAQNLIGSACMDIGDIVLSAFCTALGIASPSRLTMGLGIYLLQGLQEGLSQNIGTFKPDLGNLSTIIYDALTKDIDKALADTNSSMSLKKLDLTHLGIEVDAATLMSEAGWTHLDEAYQTALKDRYGAYTEALYTPDTDDAWWAEYTAQYGAQDKGPGLDAFKSSWQPRQLTIDEATDRWMTEHAAENEERYVQWALENNPSLRQGMAAGMPTQYARASALANTAARDEWMATERAQIHYDMTQTRAIQTGNWTDLFTQVTEDNLKLTKEWMRDGYKNSEALSTDLAQATFEKIRSQVLAEYGYSSIDQVTDPGEMLKIINRISETYGQKWQDIQNTMDSTVASLQDTWQSGLDALVALEAEEAQQVYETWVATFNAIAEARKAILGDKIISDEISDLSQLTAIAQQLYAQGMDDTQVKDFLTGKHDVSDVSQLWQLDNSGAWKKTGDYSYFYDSEGKRKENVSYADYEAWHRELYAGKDGKGGAGAKVWDWAKDQYDLVASETNADGSFKTKEQKLAGYESLMKLFKLSSDEWKATDQGIMNIASGQLLETWEDVRAAIGETDNAITEIIDKAEAATRWTAEEWGQHRAQATAKEAQSEGERKAAEVGTMTAWLSKQQSDLEKINTARDTGAKNIDENTRREVYDIFKKWGLLETDQETGEEISFEKWQLTDDKLARAGDTLVSTLASIAQQLKAILGMILDGSADGWRVDEKTGQVIATKSEALVARTAGQTKDKNFGFATRAGTTYVAGNATGRQSLIDQGYALERVDTSLWSAAETTAFRDSLAEDILAAARENGETDLTLDDAKVQASKMIEEGIYRAFSRHDVQTELGKAIEGTDLDPYANADKTEYAARAKNAMQKAGYSTPEALEKAAMSRAKFLNGGTTNLTSADFDSAGEQEFWANALAGAEDRQEGAKELAGYGGSSGLLAKLEKKSDQMTPEEQFDSWSSIAGSVNKFFGTDVADASWASGHAEELKKLVSGGKDAESAMTSLRASLAALVGEKYTIDLNTDEAQGALAALDTASKKMKFGDRLSKEAIAAVKQLLKLTKGSEAATEALADLYNIELDVFQSKPGDLVEKYGLEEAKKLAHDLGMELEGDAESGYSFSRSLESIQENANFGESLQDSAEQMQAIQSVLGTLQEAAAAGDQNAQMLIDLVVTNPEALEFYKDQEGTYHMSVDNSAISVEDIDLGASDSTTNVDGKVDVKAGGVKDSATISGSINSSTDATATILKGSGGGGGGAPPKTNTGGGGGGKKKQKNKSKSEIKRYHEVDQQISHYDRSMSKIEAKESMAFGSDRVKLMAQRMKELNKQMDSYQEKLNEAAAYEKKDKANLQKAAEQLGFTFEFDENGTITNWEQWQEKLIEWYNKHKDDEVEDGMESPEDVYKRLQQLSEDYENSVQTREEMEQKILEQLHAQSELYAEMLETAHQWKIDLHDLKLDMLEGQLSRMDDTLGNMGDKAKLMGEALFGADGVGLDGTSMDKLNELLALQNEIASAKTDQESIKNGEGMDEATKAEKLQEIMGKVNEQMNDLWQKGQQIQELYGQMWEKYDQELQTNAKLIENNIQAMQSFVKILELAGRQNDFDTLDQYYRKQLDFANKSVDLYMATRDTLAAEKERFDQEIKDAGGFDALDEQRQKDYKDLIARIQETDANLMSATEDVLEAAAQVYQNAVNKSIKKLDETLAMGMGDMEYLQQQYDRYTETQDRYLNTAHQLYNVNKLNRQIEGAMADTNNKALRDQYEALQNVINEKAKSGKLTQYDVDMMQKQYELLEKQAALKDAQNAKDTVRLTRDENGNYMYQYTADQDKIDEATQAYDDVLIQINELSTQRVSELEAEMLEKRKWYVEQARAIAEDETLTEEQKQERLTELRRQAAEDDIYFQEQMGIAYDNLQINGETCFNRWGDVIQAVFNDPNEGINPTIKASIENEENMADALGTAIDEIIPKLQELGRIQDQTLNRTGLEDPSEYFDSMAEETKLAMTETTKLNEKLVEQAEKINAVTQEWYKQKEVLKDLFATIEAANTENLQLLWQLGNNDTDIADPTSTGTIQYRLVPVKNSSAHSTDGHAKGGLVDYTGYHWLDGSITQPELVLSAADTANMLQTVDMLHNIDVASVQNLLALLGGLAAAMSSGGVSAGLANIITGSGAMEQDVHITAEFPNATDKAEIMAAFDELNNRASQYANRNRK